MVLKKEKGKINIKKLRVICIFKADPNWVLRVIYTKRMMMNARDQKLIPSELFVTTSTTMAKIMFTDVVLHITPQSRCC